MTPQCSICLSQFKEPVCLPCGHLYCKKCIKNYVNAPANRSMSLTCPECRKPFQLAMPDLTCLPEKYRPFISHAIRRVYIDTASSSTNEVASLKKQVEKLRKKLAKKTEHQQSFIRKCEELREKADKRREALVELRDRQIDLETRLCEVQTELKLRNNRNKKKKQDLTSSLAILQEEKQEFIDALSESNQDVQNLSARLTRSELEKAGMEEEIRKLREAAAARNNKFASSSCYSSSRSSSPEPSRAYNLRARPSDSANASASPSATRSIKPLPRRRVRRSREDDSVVARPI